MRYPIASWMPIPETSSQSRIDPHTFIVHSIAAEWDAYRLRSYWNESGVVLESHFGIGDNGLIGQYVDTSVKADANYSANSFAISVETQSNREHTDPWTAAQVESIIDLMVYAHLHDGIPLRIARTWNGGGFGYHKMFPEWSKGPTACPGAARVNQFHDVIWPEVVRRVKGNPPPSGIPPFPGRQYFYIGAYNQYVTALDNRLIAKGYARFHDGDGYQPGPRYTTYTQMNVQAFQKAQGWTGSDADGFPGPETWKRLFS